jgi:hypothetical protein
MISSSSEIEWLVVLRLDETSGAVVLNADRLTEYRAHLRRVGLIDFGHIDLTVKTVSFKCSADMRPSGFARVRRSSS